MRKITLDVYVNDAGWSGGIAEHKARELVVELLEEWDPDPRVPDEEQEMRVRFVHILDTKNLDWTESKARQEFTKIMAESTHLTRGGPPHAR